MILSWLKWLLGGSYYDNKPADTLFLNFIEIITEQKFLKKLNIQNEFDNKLACMAAFMFCWQEYLAKHKQKKLSQQFIDLTVKLLDDSLREQGVSDIRVGKKVKQKLQNFYAQMIAYDKLFGKENGAPTKINLQKIMQNYLKSSDNTKAISEHLLNFRTKLNKIKPKNLTQNNTIKNLLAI